MIQKTFGTSYADYSDDERYRYRLFRTWFRTDHRPRILYIMLNPSKATEQQNDPTVERCQRRALALGFCSMMVCNVFAWRATDPRVLPNVLHNTGLNPVGTQNLEVIISECLLADMILAAWGKHANLYRAGKLTLDIIRSLGRPIYCLKQNFDGSPVHPLYQPYSRKPVLLEER